MGLRYFEVSTVPTVMCISFHCCAALHQHPGCPRTLMPWCHGLSCKEFNHQACLENLVRIGRLAFGWWLMFFLLPNLKMLTNNLGRKTRDRCQLCEVLAKACSTKVCIILAPKNMYHLIPWHHSVGKHGAKMFSTGGHPPSSPGIVYTWWLSYSDLENIYTRKY